METRTPFATEAEVAAANETGRRILEGMREVIRGKDEFLTLLLAGLFAGGHVLIEDLPGLGKTTVAKTLAALIAGDAWGDERFFRRIQCTPDLLPYDITGVDVFNPESRDFEFRPGPVFAHVLLADEINRTTPKVQSALLEVMAERQVTVGLETRVLERPFFVIATQNPVETEGTYALPLAQADRFLLRLSIGYPDAEAEFSIVTDDPASTRMPEIGPVCGREELIAVQDLVPRIFCDAKLVRAVIAAANASRTHRGVLYGISPRGSLMLVRAGRALALLRGRPFVIDQDLVDAAPAVLAHRMKLKDAKLSPLELGRDLVLGAVASADGG